MKKILFNNASKGLPVDHPLLKLLQDQSIELVNAMISLMISGSYTPDDLIILYGCEVTIDGSDYEVTAGAIFLNGEIYFVDPTAFTAAGGEVGVWVTSSTTTDANFGDGSAYPIEENQKLKLESGDAGSGLANHDEVKYILRRLIMPLGAWDMQTETIRAMVLPLTEAEMRRIKRKNIMVINDDGSELRELSEDGNIELEFATLELGMELGPSFTGANYNDGAINRGHVYIEYGDI